MRTVRGEHGHRELVRLPQGAAVGLVLMEGGVTYAVLRA